MIASVLCSLLTHTASGQVSTSAQTMLHQYEAACRPIRSYLNMKPVISLTPELHYHIIIMSAIR